MDLDKVNEIFNTLKESKFVKNFISELTNYIENNLDKGVDELKFSNLLSNDLEIGGTKVTARFRDEMLTQRKNILNSYANETKDNGEMYYIYNNDHDKYQICVCEEGRSHEVIAKKADELPKNAKVGSVLRNKVGKLEFDMESTKDVNEQINEMISKKMQEQSEYLESKRIEGHIYEVGEKGSGRVWLYDSENIIDGGIEGVEEIQFPKDLYETAKEGDKYIYSDGKYSKYSGSI